MIGVRFNDDEYRDAVNALLLAARRGVGHPDDVRAMVGQTTTADEWVELWTGVAGAAWAAAKAIDAAPDGRGALAHYRRAAGYYAAALAIVRYSGEPQRHGDLWRRQRSCWERTVELSPVPGERLAIPYEGDALPGYFFAGGAGRRPLVIVDCGDGPTSEAWTQAGAAATERGFHWMTFDGPGQQRALLDQDLARRHDWEAVLSPVVDAMLARPDVDPERVAVVGTGSSGYLVTRALAFEHRLAAAVADPGIADLAAPLLAALPDELRHDLEHERSAAFERELHLAELFDPRLATTLDIYAAPHGSGIGSRYELFKLSQAFRLDSELGRIRTPLLVTSADDDQRWQGQAERIRERLPASASLLRVPVGDGDRGTPHDVAILDWLARYLGDDE